MGAPRAPFRFGVVLVSEACSRAEWMAKCRRAEELGYDVVSACEHVNLPSPFPSVILAAEATERPRIGIYVLNTSFHNPTLLARDVVTVDQFVEGRLELGLGTGYVEWEFQKAGIPFGTPGSRVDRLETTIGELQRLLADPEHPKTVQRPYPPMLVGGHGNRVLRLAARNAEIVSFVGAQYRAEYGRMVIATAQEMVERSEFARAAAGARADEIEYNILSKATVITKDRRAALDQVRRFAPHLDDEQILAAPTLSIGTPEQIAEQLRENREVYGINYVTVMEPAMEAFGRVIEVMR
ncbi:TIGR03621 family F420-dependent LLM class oxidoreductase [Allokutzneria sp. A3M-2-11 16]|uniref:TIGR03621 family F420-dependent LLM class oxidoreductase n=1 Tax=Allokutzneria sp. A3M-2-11 16 TaxID=2962043 RepID=UPI0020B69D33|nr:TIGR03621 family F420-dependent LLM class oxidoreductase [Allokutzneria sp. A3M-2-11 16]MCP3800798.1 TIGR03621 family F420-dependent LLM class oxidoreductase [Allokutzneria sp. A3M-2-11 16]